MSNGRPTFNLQSSEQMEEFRKLLGGKYVRGNKTSVTRVEEDEEHSSSLRHRRPASGEAK